MRRSLGNPCFGQSRIVAEGSGVWGGHSRGSQGSWRSGQVLSGHLRSGTDRNSRDKDKLYPQSFPALVAKMAEFRTQICSSFYLRCWKKMQSIDHIVILPFFCLAASPLNSSHDFRNFVILQEIGSVDSSCTSDDGTVEFCSVLPGTGCLIMYKSSDVIVYLRLEISLLFSLQGWPPTAACAQTTANLAPAPTDGSSATPARENREGDGNIRQIWPDYFKQF